MIQSGKKYTKNRSGGGYPAEPIIRFVARNYYDKERKQIRVLDFGCGAGSNAWYLAREGFQVYAFDGSEIAVQKSRKKIEQENLKADFRVRDALELDYETNFFDCVIDGAAIYANRIENILKMYQTTYELLKSGGKIFSICFSKNTTGYGSGIEIEPGTFKDIHTGCLSGRGTAHFYSKEEITQILEGIGYKKLIVDIMRWSDRGSTVEEYLVQATK